MGEFMSIHGSLPHGHQERECHKSHENDAVPPSTPEVKIRTGSDKHRKHSSHRHMPPRKPAKRSASGAAGLAGATTTTCHLCADPGSTPLLDTDSLPKKCQSH